MKTRFTDAYTVECRYNAVQYNDIAYIIVLTEEKYKSEFKSPKYIPYLVLNNLYTGLRPSCHLWATRELLGRWVVAQTQKVLLLCNCCSTTLVPSMNDQSCCSGTTVRTQEAEWRQNHYQGDSRVAVVAKLRHRGRHGDRSMDAIGRPKKARWWCKEGRSIAQIDTQCSHKYAFLRGDQWPTAVHPFCDHGDVCAFRLPPLSDLWATDLLGDLSAPVLNMLKTSRRPWRPWRCLNVLCTTVEPPKHTLVLRSAFNGDLASFVVAQVRHKGRGPCVKEVLNGRAMGCISRQLGRKLAAL